METFQKIVFRRPRDFSEVLNATFAFIRQNFKKLGKAILFIVGPFIVLGGICSGLYNAEAAAGPASQNPANLLAYMLLMFLVSMLGSAVFAGVVNQYIVLYMDREFHEFDIDEVWQAVKKDLGMALLTALGFSFVVGVGMIFCLLPGIYLMVPLSLLLIMRIRERQPFGAAFSRCFKLMSGHWWPTFGLLLTAFLINTALSFVFYLPNYVLTFWNIVHAGEAGALTSNARLLHIVTSMIAFVGGYLFYAIPVLAVAFQYFNLVERYEAAGLFEKIDQLGASPAAGKAGL